MTQLNFRLVNVIENDIGQNEVFIWPSNWLINEQLLTFKKNSILRQIVGQVVHNISGSLQKFKVLRNRGYFD